MQTILQALEQAHKDAHIKTPLQFVKIDEFQAFLDSFNFDEFPVNVIVPFTNNGNRTDSRRKATVPLQGWMLVEIDDDTINVRTAKAYHDYVEPMTNLAIKFLTRLLEQDIIDAEVSNVTDSITPTFAFLSKRLFGVQYTMNIPIMENVPC